MDLHDLRVEEQDLSSGDLSIEASDNESLEILARGVSGGADDDIIQEAVDEETMLSYPATDGEAEVFPEPVVQQLGTDLHAKLRQMGLNAPTIKVPEGDEFQLINDNSNGTATVLYRQGNATMVSGSQPGGPDTKTRTFITSSEVTQTVAQGTTETSDMDVSQNPGILRDFPYEEDVPAQREYDLQALMLTLDSDGSGGAISLDDFRLQSEEREWIAKDSAFVSEALADYPNADLTTLPYVFPAEPTFEPGDELDLQVRATEGGTGDQDAVVDATMVFYRRGVGGGI
jgi:hypothetical protein